MRPLVSGVLGVACTLAAIVAFGLLVDYVAGLPHWIAWPWSLLGFAPLGLGLTLEAAGTHAFWTSGKGTPNPMAHPNRLVTSGPYAWSRHPLYLARHMILIGSAWLFGSLSVLILTLLLFLVVRLVMIPREEGRLAARFGQTYETYRNRVGMWVTLRRTSR